jgi:hypothetical protein
MKKILLAIILSGFSLYLVFAQSNDFDNLARSTTSPIILTIDGEQIKVHFGDTFLYIMKDSANSNTYYQPFYKDEVLPIEYNGKIALKNKYLKINGRTITAKFQSNNKKSLQVDDVGHLTVFGPGQVIISVMIDDQIARIPINVIELPLYKYMPDDNVIEILGVPDNTTNENITWPESDFFDGIFYAYRSDTETRQIQHWYYDDYPKAIFSFEENELKNCYMQGWDHMTFIRLNLSMN